MNESTIGIEEFERLKREFAQKEKAFEEQLWIDAQTNQFDEVLRLSHSLSVEEFTKVVIDTIAEITNAFSGLFYAMNPQKELEATAGYACKIENLEKTKYRIGEGIIGQVVNSRKIVFFEGLPPENVEVRISTANISVANVVVIPLEFNENIYGVIELVFIHELVPKYKTLLEKVSRNTAATLESILNQAITKDLLKNSQEQTEKLKSQEEELRQNLEELAATQELMDRQKQEMIQKEEEMKKVLEEMKANDAGSQANEERLQQLIEDLQTKNQESIEKDQEIKRLKAELDELRALTGGGESESETQKSA